MSDFTPYEGDIIPLDGGASPALSPDQTPATFKPYTGEMLPLAPAPAAEEQTPPQSVPTLKPGTGGTPPPIQYQPVPKAGWYPGPAGSRRYTDPSSASSIIARAGMEGIVGSMEAIGDFFRPLKDTSGLAPLNPEDPLAKTLNKPMSEGWTSPTWWAAKLSQGSGAMLPAVGMAAMGPEALLAKAGIFGTVNMAQTLAPAYVRARQAGQSPDDAAKIAWKDSGIALAFGTAMGLVPGATAFGNVVEGQLKQALVRTGEQILVAQPALGAGQQAATNLVEGRPVGEGVPEAAATNAALGIMMTAPHFIVGAGHGAPEGAVAPAPDQVRQAVTAAGQDPSHFENLATEPANDGGHFVIGTVGDQRFVVAKIPPESAAPLSAPAKEPASQTPAGAAPVEPVPPVAKQAPPLDTPAARLQQIRPAAPPTLEETHPGSIVPVSESAAGEALPKIANDLAKAEAIPGEEGRAEVLRQEQEVIGRTGKRDIIEPQNAPIEPQIRPRAPRPIAESRELSLNEFLADRGGVRDDTGELRAADLHMWHQGRRFPRGQIMGRLVRDDGAHPDYAREAAAEAGYLPPDGSTPSDLYEAMREDAAGRRVYPHGAQPEGREPDPAAEEHQRQIWADKLRRELESLGERDVANISDDALADRLTERLATIGADDVPNAVKMIQEETAAADARLRGNPEIANALEEDKGTEDFQPPPEPEVATTVSRAKLVPVRTPEGGVQWHPIPIEELANERAIGAEGAGDQTAVHAAPPAGERPPVHAAASPEDLAAGSPAPNTAEQGDQGPEAVKTRAGVSLSKMIAAVLNLPHEPKISIKQIQKMAEEAYSGTLANGDFDRKDMFDALELGVNRYIETSGKFEMADDAAGAAATVAGLRELVMRLPTQTVRSEEQQRFQQFSTPPDYAYAIAWLADISERDHVLEPSAGTGSLVAAAKLAGPEQMVVNELSPRRAAMLDSLLDKATDQAFHLDASQLHNLLPDEVKPTVVVMNPPFSQTAGRMGDRKDPMVAARHIGQALDQLEPGGRLVAIVGQGMAPENRHYSSFFDGIRQESTLRANVLVSGQVYGKYGTTFGTRVLVIDKAPGGAQIQPIGGSVATIPDLIEHLQGVRGRRADLPAQDRGSEQGPAQPGREAVAQPGEDAGRPNGGLPAGAGDMGTGAEPGDTGARPGGEADVPGAERQPDAGVGTGGVDALGGEQPGRRQPGPAEGDVAAGPGEREGPDRGGAPDTGADRGPPQGDESGLPTGGEPSGVAPLEVAGKTPEEATEREAADLGAVYEGYRPQRLAIPGAQEHPGPLVQSAAMASVEPPEATYKPRLPDTLIKSGGLSLPQLETVVYAGQAHNDMLPAEGDEPVRRRGYFIGDGTGVGKGREVAGIILDNWNQGRRQAVWVSEKQPLLEDARRDWKGVGQDPNHIFLLNKTAPGEAIKAKQGIMFATYDTMKGGLSDQEKIAQGKLVRGQKVTVGKFQPREGVISSGNAGGTKQKPTYRVTFKDGQTEEIDANRIEPGEQVKTQTRVDQIVGWLGPKFDGVIAFDEAHNMGNATDSKGSRGLKQSSAKARAGLELQQRLPNARVVYVSATGATEVSNLAYADRLGLWGRGTAFPTRDAFVAKIEDGGIAAMELVARDMKAMGAYISRALSYKGVEYNRLEHPLTLPQREIYDELAGAWQVTLQNFNKALEETAGNLNGRAKGAAYSAFWGSHQRFFNQIITSMQMPSVLRSVEGDLQAGRQAVLQLVNTNEASQERAVSKAESPQDLEDLDITPRDQLIQLIERSFPTQQFEERVDDNGNRVSVPVTDSEGNPVESKKAVAMREALIDRLASIRVPQGPLDLLLDHFGVDNVAEVTGRKRRFVLRPDDSGNVKRVEDARAGNANIAEANAFQAGQKKVLVFSQAGGTGRSYHADNTTGSAGARRAHYLVQAGWRADAAIQGFGRTHRTNQASAPIFRLVTTDLQGQKRFISSIARRLAQLGALTKGQRQTGDQGVFSAKDNLESSEAHDALRNFYTDLKSSQIPGLTQAEFEAQTGLSLQNEEKMPAITQFLNRILSLKIDAQNQVFGAFEERLQHIIDMKSAAGTLDVGLETIRSDGARKADDQVVYTDKRSGAETKYVRVELQHRIHPMEFDTALSRSPLFFVQSQRGKLYSATDGGNRTDENGGVTRMYRLQAPDEYHYVEQHKIDNSASWTKIKDEEAARTAWDQAIGKLPEFRKSNLHLITGAVLPIWDRLKGNPKVVRLQTDDGERLLGRVLPEGMVAPTLKALGAEAKGVERKPADLVSDVLGGKSVTLSNGWRLKRSTVAGEKRIEVVGPETYSEGAALKQEGVFSERIQFKNRYFIPTGDDAEKVMAAVTKYRPVAEVGASASAEESYSRREAREPAAGARHDPEALKDYLRQRLDHYGLSDVGIKFAQKILNGEANGSYDKKLIKIALDLPGREIRTLDHEAIHALRDMGMFTQGEWSALVRAAKIAEDPRGKHGTIAKAVAAAGYEPKVADEEAVAIFHSFWAEGRYTPGGLIGRALRKVARFFEGLENWLRGSGFHNADDVLGALTTGKMAGREGGQRLSKREPGIDQTPEGEQRVIPGAEKISDRQLAERNMESVAKVKAPQRGIEGLGLFDPQKQGELFSRREDEAAGRPTWPADFPNTATSTTIQKLKDHPDYETAKRGGDAGAAERVVLDSLKPRALAAIDQMVGDRKPIVVPVQLLETGSAKHNRIPGALADAIAFHIGSRTETDIVQVNRTGHTEKGFYDRVASRPLFDGPVQPGQDYLVVDDVLTYGSTMASLIGHIQRGGGNVIGSAVLATGRHGATLALTPDALARLRGQHGSIEPLWQQLTGSDFSGATANEARQLLAIRSTDDVRSRLAEAGSRRSVQANQGVPRDQSEDGGPLEGGTGDPLEKLSRREPDAREAARAMRGVVDGDPPETAVRTLPIIGTRLRIEAGGLVDRFIRDAQIKVVPMSTGADEARAVAKDFANNLRKARWQWSQIDDVLKHSFTKEQREDMGRALDEQSVAAQSGEALGPDGGLQRLDPRQRDVVAMLDGYGRDLWQRAQAVGMVKGEGLPHYMPRFLVELTGEGKVKPVGKGGPGVSAMDPTGQNLTTTTSNLLHRKYLRPEETLAAGQARFGEGTALVTDIRALGLALGRLERAIAGKELMNSIKTMGTRMGMDLVRDGEAQGYFTLDHPAFTRYQPRLERNEAGEWKIVKDENGREIFDRVPMYVSRAFEGPLRAVLSKQSGAVYSALMALKGKAMSVIMYSPLIHNAVEWGRALPLMPGKVLTLRAYFEGNAFKKDAAAMGQAIQDGLVPIGHRGYETDITGIENEPSLEPGRSWTAKGLGLPARVFGKEASDKVMAAVDRAGDWWHGTMLWDRVGDLQAGIYKNIRDDMMSKGVDERSAGRVAAHLANRFAGALPNESMSDMARKLGNLTLFSRTFTLGNLSVVKDMVTGLPKDIQNQIQRDSGTLARGMAVSAGRRAAIGAFIIDVALFYGMNSVLQDVIDHFRRDKSLSDIEKGYADRFWGLLHRAKEDPLSVLNPFEDLQALSSTSANEPGKENRVLWGYDKNGTAIYLRSPIGKIGEEFAGWVTSPLEMIRKKESTFARPLLQILSNDQGFGRWVYDPNDKSVAGMVSAAGRIAWHFLTSQIPTSTIQGAYDLVTGQGDQSVNAYKVLGPMVGLTFSKGAPGGPAVGQLFQIRQAHSQAVNAAMPEITRQILRGDTQGAIEGMVKLGMTPSEIKLRIRYALNPGARINPSSMKRIEHYADPEALQRLLQMDAATP